MADAQTIDEEALIGYLTGQDPDEIREDLLREQDINSLSKEQRRFLDFMDSKKKSRFPSTKHGSFQREDFQVQNEEGIWEDRQDFDREAFLEFLVDEETQRAQLSRALNGEVKRKLNPGEFEQIFQRPLPQFQENFGPNQLPEVRADGNYVYQGRLLSLKDDRVVLDLRALDVGAAAEAIPHGLADAVVMTGNAALNSVGLISDEEEARRRESMLAEKTERFGNQGSLRFMNDLGPNALSGIAQIVGDVPGLYALGESGATALFTTQSFGEALFRDGGQQAIQDHINEFGKRVIESNPEIGKEAFADVIEEYQESDEFYEFINTQLRPGLAFAAGVASASNEALGLERADRQSVADTFAQALGAAGIGIPRSVAKKLADELIVGTLDSVTGQILLRTGEIATPLTLPLTGTNVALNAGAATGIDAIIRTATGEPWFPSNESTVPVGAEEDAIDWGAISLVLGGSGTVLLIRHIAKEQARLAQLEVTRAGPSFDEQRAEMEANAPVDEDALEPQLGSKSSDETVVERQFNLRGTDSTTLKTAAGNEYSAITDAARQVGGRTLADRAEGILTNNLGASGEAGVDNARRHGIFDRLDHKSVPLTQLQQLLTSMPTEQAELALNYIAARNAQADRLIRAQDLDKQIREAQLSAISNPTKWAPILQDLNAQKVAMNNDKADTRPNLRGWDNQKINEIIAAAEGDERVMLFANQYKQLANDLAEYRFRNGIITESVYKQFIEERPFYMPLREDDFGGSSGFERFGEKTLKGFSNWFTGKGTQQTLNAYTTDALRDTSGEGFVVNNPVNALDAMDDHIGKLVRQTQANTARREIIDLLKDMPADRQLLREVKVTKNASEEKLLADPNVIPVYEEGGLRFYEFGDPILRHALEFAPHSSIQWMDRMRKMWQNGTTGVLNPAFAPVSALMDHEVINVTRAPGRSFGMMDQGVRMLFQEGETANAVMDHLGGLDPTSYIQTLDAIFRMWGRQGQRAMGEAIGRDLATESGFFNTLAQTTGGAEHIQNLGETMVRSFDQSTYGVLVNAKFGHAAVIDDVFQPSQDYTRSLTTATSTTRQALAGWASMTEAVKEGARYAFFIQNYARLDKKFGGNIPEDQLQLLIAETKNTSGNFSRQPGSKWLQNLNSAVPYANVTIQATRHMMAETAGRATEGDWAGMSRLTTAVVLPTVMTNYIMSNYSEESAHWWWNETPEWQRMSHYMVPKPHMVEAWSRGEKPSFNPDDFYMIRKAYEFIPISEAIIAGTNSMGITAPQNNPDLIIPGIAEQFQHSMETTFGLVTPPIVNAAGAAANAELNMEIGEGMIRRRSGTRGAGIDSEQMMQRSEINKTTYEIITALTGTAGKYGFTMMDSYTLAEKQGKPFHEAVDAALTNTIAEVATRTPDLPPLWEASRRHYWYTPEARAVYQLEDTLGLIFKQKTADNRTDDVGTLNKALESGEQLEDMGKDVPDVMKDNSEAAMLAATEFTARRIQDPQLREIVVVTGKAFQAKPMWQWKRDRSTIRNLISDLDSGRVDLPPAERKELKDMYIKNLQELNTLMYRHSQQWLRDMEAQYGEYFEQTFGEPFSPEALVKAVDQNAQ